MKEEKQEAIVRIIASDKKKQRAAYYHAPEFGPDGKPVYYFDNDSSLSKEEKEALRNALPISEVSDESGVIKLQHLLQLRLTVPRDKAIYYYLKNAPEGKVPVALNKNKMNPSLHRFFIENKEADAESGVKHMSIKFKALKVANDILSGQSKENDLVRDALRLIGIPVKGLSVVQAQDVLLKEADTQPTRFLRVLDDQYRNYRIFIIKLIERGTIKKSRSGSYTHGDANNIIAMNDSQMVAFLQDKKNDALIRIWANDMDDTSIVGAAKSVEEGLKEKGESSRLNINTAVSRINKMESEEEINSFIEGEQRPAVINVANKKINSFVTAATA